MAALSDADSIASLETDVPRIQKKRRAKPKAKGQNRSRRPRLIKRPPRSEDESSIPSLDMDHEPALGSSQVPAHEALAKKAAECAQKAKTRAAAMASKVASMTKAQKSVAASVRDLQKADRLEARAAKQMDRLKAQSAKAAEMTQLAEMRLAKQMGQEENPSTTISVQAHKLDKEITPKMWDEVRARGQHLAAQFEGQVFALEIYAGCCRWSGAVAEAGLNVFVPIDRAKGKHAWADTNNPWVRAVLLVAIDLGRIWYVHLATDCRTRPGARTTGTTPVPVGPVFFTMQVLRAVVNYNLRAKSSEASPWQLPFIYMSIENPWPSNLFSLGDMQSLLATLDTITIKYDCCAYGANYKKRSQLCTNMKALARLGKLCCHPPGTHEALEGIVSIMEEGKLVSVWKTSLAAQYVPGLCREWVEIMRSHALEQAFAPPGAPALSHHWQIWLMDCTGVIDDLPQPICPATFVCPWARAFRVWSHKRVAPAPGSAAQRQGGQAKRPAGQRVVARVTRNPGRKQVPPIGSTPLATPQASSKVLKRPAGGVWLRQHLRGENRPLADAHAAPCIPNDYVAARPRPAPDGQMRSSTCSLPPLAFHMIMPLHTSTASP